MKRFFKGLKKADSRNEESLEDSLIESAIEWHPCQFNKNLKFYTISEYWCQVLNKNAD